MFGIHIKIKPLKILGSVVAHLPIPGIADAEHAVAGVIATAKKAGVTVSSGQKPTATPAAPVQPIGPPPPTAPVTATPAWLLPAALAVAAYLVLKG